MGSSSNRGWVSAAAVAGHILLLYVLCSQLILPAPCVPQKSTQPVPDAQNGGRRMSWAKPCWRDPWQTLFARKVAMPYCLGPFERPRYRFGGLPTSAYRTPAGPGRIRLPFPHPDQEIPHLEARGDGVDHGGLQVGMTQNGGAGRDAGLGYDSGDLAVGSCPQPPCESILFSAFWIFGQSALPGRIREMKPGLAARKNASRAKPHPS